MPTEGRAATAPTSDVSSDASAGTTALAAPRLAWLDATRGTVVFLVVLMHLVHMHYLPVLGHLDEAISGAWVAFNDLVAGVRMPALLLISGWLASSRVLQGLGSARTRQTLATSVWLYLVWLTVYAVITLEGQPNAVGSWQEYARNVLMPDTSLWFIAALFWYVFVLAGLRAVPGPLMVAATLALGWAATTMLEVDQLWARIPELAVFFALGVYGRRWLTAAAAAPLAGLAAAAVWALLWTADLSVAPRVEYPLTVVSSMAAVMALLTLSSGVSALAPALATPMAWLGRRTLGVYVLHFPLIGGITLLATRLVTEEASASGGAAVLWLYPLVATVLVVAASALLESGLRRAGATWLFTVPQRQRTSETSGRGPRRTRGPMCTSIDPTGRRHG